VLPLVAIGEKVLSHWVAPRRRRRLIERVPVGARILEIGPGPRPVFPKSRFPNAKTVDHTTREELIRKFLPTAGVSAEVLASQIEEVDYVWQSGPLHDLFAKDDRFDLVFSSHNLEHQTDLISHFRSIQQLLTDAGEVIFVVPDYRRTFDAIRYPSTTSDVLIAQEEQRQRHSGKAAFDSLAYSIEVNPGRTVRRADLRKGVFSYSLDQAKKSFDAHPTAESAPYEDRHAWVFSPRSLEILLIELFLLDLIALVAIEVTPSAGNEFHCRLTHARRAADHSGGAETLRAGLEKRRKSLFVSQLPR